VHRNALLEVERVEQPTLIAGLPPHHDPPPDSPKPTESQLVEYHEPFFNSIDPKRTYGPYSITSSARARRVGGMVSLIGPHWVVRVGC
jgi:hypothetical protein